MASKKFDAIVEFKVDTKNADKAAGKFLDNLKRSLNELETAEDKFLVFKKLASYLSKFDKQLSDLKINNQELFDKIFSGIDDRSFNQLFQTLNKVTLSFEDLTGFVERFNKLNERSKFQDFTKIAADLNNLNRTLTGKPLFDDFGKVFNDINDGKKNLESVTFLMKKFTENWKQETGTIDSIFQEQHDKFIKTQDDLREYQDIINIIINKARKGKDQIDIPLFIPKKVEEQIELAKKLKKTVEDLGVDVISGKGKGTDEYLQNVGKLISANEKLEALIDRDNMPDAFYNYMSTNDIEGPHDEADKILENIEKDKTFLLKVKQYFEQQLFIQDQIEASRKKEKESFTLFDEKEYDFTSFEDALKLYQKGIDKLTKETDDSVRNKIQDQLFSISSSIVSNFKGDTEELEDLFFELEEGTLKASDALEKLEKASNILEVDLPKNIANLNESLDDVAKKPEEFNEFYKTIEKIKKSFDGNVNFKDVDNLIIRLKKIREELGLLGESSNITQRDLENMDFAIKAMEDFKEDNVKRMTGIAKIKRLKIDDSDTNIEQIENALETRTKTLNDIKKFLSDDEIKSYEEENKRIEERIRLLKEEKKEKNKQKDRQKEDSDKDSLELSRELSKQKKDKDKISKELEEEKKRNKEKIKNLEEKVENQKDIEKAKGQEKLNSFLDVYSEEKIKSINFENDIEIGEFIGKLKSAKEELISISKEAGFTKNQLEEIEKVYSSALKKIDRHKNNFTGYGDVSWGDYEHATDGMVSEAEVNEYRDALHSSIEEKYDLERENKRLQEELSHRIDGNKENADKTKNILNIEAEKEALSNLILILDNVKTSIENKTLAFKDEENVVNSVIANEIQDLDNLLNRIEGIKTSLKGINGSKIENDEITKEKKKLENINDVLQKIISKISIKTSVFANESAVVGTVIDTEIQDFNSLLDKLKELETVTFKISNYMSNIKISDDQISGLKNVVKVVEETKKKKYTEQDFALRKAKELSLISKQQSLWDKNGILDNDSFDQIQKMKNNLLDVVDSKGLKQWKYQWETVKNEILSTEYQLEKLKKEYDITWREYNAPYSKENIQKQIIEGWNINAQQKKDQKAKDEEDRKREIAIYDRQLDAEAEKLHRISEIAKIKDKKQKEIRALTAQGYEEMEKINKKVRNRDEIRGQQYLKNQEREAREDEKRELAIYDKQLDAEAAKRKHISQIAIAKEAEAKKRKEEELKAFKEYELIKKEEKKQEDKKNKESFNRETDRYNEEIKKEEKQIEEDTKKENAYYNRILAAEEEERKRIIKVAKIKEKRRKELRELTAKAYEAEEKENRDQLNRELENHNKELENKKKEELEEDKKNIAIYDGILAAEEERRRQISKIAKAKDKTRKDLNKYQSTFMVNADFKKSSIINTIEENGLGNSALIKNSLNNYLTAYQNVMQKISAIKAKGTPVSVEDEEVLKRAKLELSEFQSALNKLITQSSKLKKKGFATEILGEDFIDSESGRKSALEDFALSIEGIDASTIHFSKTADSCSFAVKNMDGTVSNITAQFDEAKSAIVAVEGSTKQTIGSLEAFWNELKYKFKSIGTYLVASFGFSEIWSIFKQGVNSVREIDMALTELKKVTNETDIAYNNFLKDMSQTANIVGANVKDLTMMAAEWARLGYSMEEAGKLAKSTAVLLNVSEFENAEEASKALISTMQAFDFTADESSHVVDILNEVGNNFAISSDGIATALKHSASSLMSAGNSLEQSVALIASANKVVQDPDSVGSALRTIALRIRGTSVEVLQEMGEDIDGVAESTSKLQAKVKALSGVDILNADGSYKDTYTILKDIGEVWEDISDIDQAALLELLAGKNRANTLAAILGNMKDLKGAYESAMTAEGSAMKENEKYLDSIQGRIDLFNNSVQTMWMNLLDSGAVKFFVDLGTAIVKTVDKLGAFPSVITAFSSFKIASSEITKNLKNLQDQMDKTKDSSEGVSDAVEESAKATVKTQEEQVKASIKTATAKKVDESATEKLTIAEKLGNAVGLQDVTINKLQEISAKKLATAKAVLVGLAKGIGSGILIGMASMLATKAIEKVGKAISDQIHKAEILKDKVKEINEEYKKSSDEISDNLEKLTTSSDKNKYKDLEEEFAELTKGVDKLGNNISLTSDEYERYEGICNVIVGINPSLAVGYDDVTTAIGNNASALSNLIELQRIQAKLNAQEYISPDNLSKILEDKQNDLETLSKEYKNFLEFDAYEGFKSSISGSGFSIAQETLPFKISLAFEKDNIFDKDYVTPEDIIPYIIDKLNLNLSEEQIKEYSKTENLSKFYKKYYQQIIDNVTVFGSNTLTYMINQFKENSKKIDAIKSGMIEYFLQIPIASDDYGLLNDSSKSFITEWIKNSDIFKIDENTTEKEIEDRRNIITGFISDIVNGNYYSEIEENGQPSYISASDILDRIFNLNPSDVNWGKYKKDTETLLNALWDSIGQDKNILGIKDKNSLSSILGIDMSSFFGDESKESKMIDRYKKIANTTRAEAVKYFDSLPAIAVNRLLDIDWNLVDENNLNEILNGSISFDLMDYSNSIESITGNIEKYRTALNSLNEGNFTEKDFVELIKEFPELAKGVDISSKKFKGLATNLKKAIKNSPKKLVKELKDLKVSLEKIGKPTDELDSFIQLVENMPSDSIEDITGKYMSLSKEIENARIAQTELEKAMQEDGSDGFKTRAEAIEKMKELMTLGMIGTESQLWSIAKEFGFTYDSAKTIEENADALYEFINARNDFYKKDKEGNNTYKNTSAFLEKVSKEVQSGDYDDLGITWDYSDGAWNVDLPNDKISEFVKRLSETKELIGLTEAEFIDLLRQAGLYHEVKAENFEDKFNFINKILESDDTAENKVAEYKEAMQEAFGLGDVDLTDREEIEFNITNFKDWYDYYISELEKAVESGNKEYSSWLEKEIEAMNAGDSIATLYSSTYFKSDFKQLEEGESDSAIVLTPILPNGEIISPENLSKYAEDALVGSGEIVPEGITLGIFDNKEDLSGFEEYLHLAQEEYFKLLRSIEQHPVDKEKVKANIEQTVAENSPEPDPIDIPANLSGNALPDIITLENKCDALDGRVVNITTKETREVVEKTKQEKPWYAKIFGGAAADGKDNVVKSGTDLVGELGTEILVRDGQWSTIGENGAEFIHVKPGDIIFNHKQSESLLESGKIKTRGKAYVSGNSTNKKYKFSDMSSGASSASADEIIDKLNKIFDWIEIRLEEIDKVLSLNDAKLENAIGSDDQNKIIDEMLELNKMLYKNLLSGANEYYIYAEKLLDKVPSQYREMAQNGAIAIETFVKETDEKTISAIEAYRDWVSKGDDATQRAEEILKEISSLAKQAIDNIEQNTTNINSLTESKISQLEAYNKYLETTQGSESTEIYNAIIDANKEKISEMQKQKEDMQNELNRAVESGDIKKGSQDWYDAVNAIAAVDTEIIELTTNINEYQDSINALHWESFERFENKLSNISGELDSLIDVLSNEKLVDETGGLTEAGITSLGLYAQKMEVAEKQASEYDAQIRYLNENWKELGYTEDEYNEKLEELKSKQYESIQSYQDSKKAIVDLQRARVEEIKNGINKEIEAYEKLINAKKEELDAEKDLHDFRKNVKAQEKDIADIERQIAALSNDNSASARAKKAQLEVELAEKQEALDETYYDRSVENQQEALDKELEAFKEEKDKEIENWELYLEDTEKVVQDSLNNVQASTEIIYQNLQNLGQEYSLNISESITSPWVSGQDAIHSYETAFGQSMSNMSLQLDQIGEKYDELNEKINSLGEEYVKQTETNQENYQSAEQKQPAVNNQENNSDNNKTENKTPSLPKVGDNVRVKTSAKKFGSNSNNANMASFVPGGSYTAYQIDGTGQNAQVLIGRGGEYTGWVNLKDLEGYANGSKGIKKNQLAWIDELGEELQIVPGANGRLEYLKKGTGILNKDLTNRLISLAMNPQEMLDKNRPSISSMPEVTNNVISIDNSISELIHIDNCTTDSVKDIKNIVDKALEKHMERMNNSLRKYAR